MSGFFIAFGGFILGAAAMAVVVFLAGRRQPAPYGQIYREPQKRAAEALFDPDAHTLAEQPCQGWGCCGMGAPGSLSCRPCRARKRLSRPEAFSKETFAEFATRRNGPSADAVGEDRP